jgi:hypothetical protein
MKYYIIDDIHTFGTPMSERGDSNDYQGKDTYLFSTPDNFKFTFKLIEDYLNSIDLENRMTEKYGRTYIEAYYSGSMGMYWHEITLKFMLTKDKEFVHWLDKFGVKRLDFVEL